MKKRALIIFILLLTAFLVPSGKMIYIISSDAAAAADKQSGVRLEIENQRGTIYDCSLKPLTNRTYKYIAAIPPTDAGRAAVSALPDSAQILARLKDGKPVLCEVPPDFSQDGITVIKAYDRYGSIPTAPHIIGYLDAESKGTSGIEKAYEEALQCDPVEIVFRSDAKGQILSGIEPEIKGDLSEVKKGISLTIDAKIQSAAEKAAKNHLVSGAVVVLEVATGKIKAMVSLPDFSQNALENSLKNPNSPFVNRAISGYNSGSIFKLCTAAAALETGISPAYTCHSSIKIGTNTFGCLKGKSHGPLTMETALMNSCNTYFINLGQKVGGDKVYNMAKSFTFGSPRKLCSSITASGGHLPSYYSVTNQPAALANFSFGQGDLLTTPLQIASMCQTIANGGKLVLPTLIEGTVNKNGNLQKDPATPPTYVLSQKTADILKNDMIRVVENGTGMSAKPKRGGAGGKTATAETGWNKNGKSILQAWFAGFFPANTPKYAVAVLAENGKTGGTSAAPVFKEIADALS